MKNEPSIQQAQQLIARLERLSADSVWAHQASGLRNALLRTLEQLETGRRPTWKPVRRLDQLIEQGYMILENAAREIMETK